jgi:hypothetical protein
MRLRAQWDAGIIIKIGKRLQAREIDGKGEFTVPHREWRQFIGFVHVGRVPGDQGFSVNVRFAGKVMVA